MLSLQNKAALVKEVGRGLTYKAASAKLNLDIEEVEIALNELWFRCLIVDVSVEHGRLKRATERGLWN